MIDLRSAAFLEPEAAIAFFEAKGYRITWDWQEMLGNDHARAFTVAKMAQQDLLVDTREALLQALREGQTLEQFRRNLEPTLRAKGWWGRKEVTSPDGVTETVQLGSPRRLETIYRANLQSAYMAGRYEQMMDTADDFPYWEYVAVLDARTRPSHRAMHGRVFRFDDPVWRTHYPPNDWRCRCRVRPLSAASGERRAESSAGRLTTETVETGPDRATGEVRTAQVTYLSGLLGMDGKPARFAPAPGWNGNPAIDYLRLEL